MRILITGACGFAGSSLAHAWQEAGNRGELFGLDNLSRPGSEQNLSRLKQLGVHFHHGDLRTPSDLAELPAADWVIDAAANPSVQAGMDGEGTLRLIENNLLGTINLLEYCRRHRAGLILLSTSRVYSVDALCSLPLVAAADRYVLDVSRQLPAGVSPRGIDERFSTRPPLSLYGVTKLASEQLALEYAEAFGFPVWVNRCGVLAGAGQFGRPDQGIFSFWVNAWLRGRELVWRGFGGAGLQVRDCLHPRDLVPLLARQMSSRPAGPEKVFNLGGGPERAISLAQLSDWCSGRFGLRRPKAEPITHRYDVPWVVLDSGRAQAHWGWRPQTGLADILEEIANHAVTHPGWLELSGAG